MDISPIHSIFLFYNFKKINFYAYILSREAMASLFFVKSEGVKDGRYSE